MDKGIEDWLHARTFGRAVALLTRQTVATPRLYGRKWWWEADGEFLEKLTLEQVVDLVKRGHPQLPYLYLVGRHFEAVDFAFAHKLNLDQVVILTHPESFQRLRGTRDRTLILLGDDGRNLYDYNGGQYRVAVGAVYFLSGRAG